MEGAGKKLVEGELLVGGVVGGGVGRAPVALLLELADRGLELRLGGGWRVVG